MDHMSGCDIRRVFTFPTKDSTLQYKKCVHFWNNYPCISTLIPGKTGPYTNILMLQPYTVLTFEIMCYYANSLKKSTISNSSLNLYVYWDTLYNV